MSIFIQKWFDNFVNERCIQYIKFNENDLNYLWNKINETPNSSSSYCLKGYLTLCGYGIKKNVKDAYEYFLLASKFGNSEAIYWIGRMYYMGIYFEKNYLTAKKYFKIAIRKNNINASNDMAVCYIYGLGCKINIKKAFDLFTYAAHNNSQHAINNLNKLNKMGLCSNKQIYFDDVHFYKNKKQSLFTKIKKIFSSHNEETQSLLNM
jgi:TPR repeat protein